jgi:hypothetical protein
MHVMKQVSGSLEIAATQKLESRKVLNFPGEMHEIEVTSNDRVQLGMLQIALHWSIGKMYRTVNDLLMIRM